MWGPDAAQLGSTKGQASGRPTQHAGKIMIDRVQMLGSRVDRTELDDKAVTDDPVPERFLGDIGPVPCEMDGFTVAGIDARLLGARKRGWQMFHGVSFDDLPEEISLPRCERSSCDADFLVICPLPASVGKN